jgi:hypothetical protein
MILISSVIIAGIASFIIELSVEYMVLIFPRFQEYPPACVPVAEYTSCIRFYTRSTMSMRGTLDIFSGRSITLPVHRLQTQRCKTLMSAAVAITAIAPDTAQRPPQFVISVCQAPDPTWIMNEYRTEYRNSLRKMQTRTHGAIARTMYPSQMETIHRHIDQAKLGLISVNSRNLRSGPLPS